MSRDEQRCAQRAVPRGDDVFELFLVIGFGNSEGRRESEDSESVAKLFTLIG